MGYHVTWPVCDRVHSEVCIIILCFYPPETAGEWLEFPMRRMRQRRKMENSGSESECMELKDGSEQMNGSKANKTKERGRVTCWHGSFLKGIYKIF